MKRYFLVILISFAVLNLTAQVITKKTSPNKVDESVSLSNKTDIDVITMPAIDVNKLLEEDEIDKDRNVPFRFGYDFEVNYNMKNSGTWTKIDSGRIWSLKIVAPGAYSINLAFSKFYLPENSTMYIYNDDKTVLQGPYTSENNSKNENLSTDLVEGSAIILEYFEPEKVKGQGKISISKIVHGYRNLFPKNTKSYGSSGSCNIDINCPEGNAWQDESNAVAMILIDDTRWCSGCMVNNTNQDFTPYFLTANHCIEGQNVNSWTFRFQYKSPTCGGSDDYSYYSYHGAALEAHNAISDFALLELDSRPAANTGISYAGWSRTGVAPNSSVGIHHPNGDVMKISIENNPAISVAWGGGQANSHWRVSFDDGVVEHGSSGSPLFDPNHRVVGQLHGNQNYNSSLPYCDQPIGEYGRFDVSWNNGLAAFLDPNNTGDMTTNTVEIPYITGSSTVCSSNSTFTLHNIPPGVTPLWTKSTNLSEVGENDEPIYTVRAISSSTSGMGWVQANINGTLFRQTFWVGKPITPLISFPFNKVGLNSYIETSATSLGATYYNWTINGGTLLWGQGTDNIALRTSSSCIYDLTVKVTSSNTCGNSLQAMKTIPYDCSGGPNPMSISPNPASEIITVELNLGNLESLEIESTEKIEDQEFTVKLINQYQMPVYQTKLKTNIFTINVSSYPIGIYYLQVIKGNNIYTKKVIVTK